MLLMAACTAVQVPATCPAPQVAQALLLMTMMMMTMSFLGPLAACSLRCKTRALRSLRGLEGRGRGDAAARQLPSGTGAAKAAYFPLLQNMATKEP